MKYFQINENTRCLIIQFQALNAEVRVIPKESTFVMSKHDRKESCNVSRIDGSKNKETINSEDGKCGKTRGKSGIQKLFQTLVTHMMTHS